MSRASSDVDRAPLLGALLRLASQAMTEQFSRWIASSGFKGVQPSHSAVIQPLWKTPEGARITAVARASSITKQSVSGMVSELEATGYVERVPDPEDSRAVRVRLTARGRAYGEAVRKFSRSIEADWGRKIGMRRMEQLRGTLEVLRSEIFQARESAARARDSA